MGKDMKTLMIMVAAGIATEWVIRKTPLKTFFV